MGGYVESFTDPSYCGPDSGSHLSAGGQLRRAPPRRLGASMGLRIESRSRCRASSSSTVSTPKPPRGQPHAAANGSRRRRSGDHWDRHPLSDPQFASTARCRVGSVPAAWPSSVEGAGAVHRDAAMRYSASSRRREPVHTRDGDCTILSVDVGAKDNIVRSLLARGASVHPGPVARRPGKAGHRRRRRSDRQRPGDPKDLAGARRQVRHCSRQFGSRSLAYASATRSSGWPPAATPTSSYGHRGVNQPVQERPAAASSPARTMATR